MSRLIFDADTLGGTTTLSSADAVGNFTITVPAVNGTMSVKDASNDATFRNITLTGAVLAGAWNGSTIAVAYGGTGATTLTGYVKGNGTSAMTGVATIPNTDITGLGTMSVQGSDAVSITGGTANGLTLGASNPAAATFTTLRFNSTLSVAGTTGTAGQVLTSNGASAPTWQNLAGSGTVTSVDGSGGTTGLTLTGGPITASGTLTLGGTLAVANGGTGSTTASAARTALGLGTMAVQAASSVAITGGAIDGTTVGSTTVAAGSFSTLNSSGNTRLGGLSGNQSLQVNNVASAVNYAQIVGAVTGNGPSFSAQGTDTNIPFVILAKGTSDVSVGGTSTTPSLKVSTVASQVNSFQIYGQATGNSPTLTAVGTDTNIGLSIAAKGTGTISQSSNGQQAFNVSTVSGSDFTNYYNSTGNLNYTAAGGSTNINFAFASKGTGAFNFTTGGGRQAQITDTASAVNYLGLTGAATTASPALSAQGSDTNISLTLTPKGTGVVSTTSLTLSNTLTTAAYTETITASGTVGASATLAITAGTILTATLTSATACTFTMPTATAGKSFTLLLKQPASGTPTTATFTGVKWNSGGAPTITATLGRLDIIAFVADGTNWYGTASQGYTY